MSVPGFVGQPQRACAGCERVGTPCVVWVEDGPVVLPRGNRGEAGQDEPAYYIGGGDR
jgi:hypothetical protein